MGTEIKIWLADDDPDDCILFLAALNQIPVQFGLTTIDNGEQLMEMLNEAQVLPDILFLDLNMPRKNGITCLIEIKKASRLKIIPVIILSTSFRQSVADQLYENGAQRYFRKPENFFQLKSLIHRSIYDTLNLSDRRPEDRFIISDSSHLNEKAE